MSRKELSKKLGKSIEAISTKLNKLNISKSKK
jgi:hypothetical protein